MTTAEAQPSARRRAAAPLFLQALALSVLSLLAAIAINLLVIFNLPAPLPYFYRVSEIAQLIRTGKAAVEKDRPILTAHYADRPDKGADFDRRDMPLHRKELGDLIGVDPSRIAFLVEFSRYPDRRAIRLIRSQMAHDGRLADDHFVIAPFSVSVQQPDGRWLIVEPKHTLQPSPWQRRLLLWLGLSLVALIPLAYIFSRRLAAPIVAFAKAAERLGRDPHAEPLALRGPAEVGVAVSAFNEMQERLSRYVGDRTAMVGAIAHDLRTPLTRIRFRLEEAPEPLREKMVADIAEMEAMISGTLAFVRDASKRADRSKLELSSLLESLADEMSETGLDVSVAHAERVVVEGDPIDLKRLFNNLLENAIKFGGSARVGVSAAGDAAVVEIDDKGPGIPETELERVFEPFYRREGSRSRDTGGIGLGLPVVRSIARAHGGDATLHNRPGGGLTARVLLPLGAV
ncbi:ATP-binding protein [Phenylobacterium montanum]|uniref:histidine kinase n=1 Tax=Phenylobacterium montanum TaxID=2823693 RepID=A0A975G1X2_9CAUL|nr:ATP-binding protein [Caulobacter sp. S6]QUD89048.1 HAMP domain-containing protein [Caulobacter sp. S6]